MPRETFRRAGTSDGVPGSNASAELTAVGSSPALASGLMCREFENGADGRRGAADRRPQADRCEWPMGWSSSRTTRGRAVFLWGMATWRWGPGDRVARRLAAVQLVESRAARQRQVARAFGVNEDSLILWRGEYAIEGDRRVGRPTTGSEGTLEADRAQAGRDPRLACGGADAGCVVERAGVSTDTVRRALAGAAPPASADVAVSEPAVVPLLRQRKA